jgi:hypothetical protein
MTNAGQSKTVNMIGVRSTISSMATGQQYNVQAISKYYWVNNNGEYFVAIEEPLDNLQDNIPKQTTIIHYVFIY